jgi:hypothetical protein
VRCAAIRDRREGVRKRKKERKGEREGYRRRKD